MGESKPARRPFLLRPGGFLLVSVLAQCTLLERPPQVRPPPQIQESTQTQSLTPEEQLELFNTFLDRG